MGLCLGNKNIWTGMPPPCHSCGGLHGQFYTVEKKNIRERLFYKKNIKTCTYMYRGHFALLLCRRKNGPTCYKVSKKKNKNYLKLLLAFISKYCPHAYFSHMHTHACTNAHTHSDFNAEKHTLFKSNSTPKPANLWTHKRWEQQDRPDACQKVITHSRLELHRTVPVTQFFCLQVA